MQGIYLLLGTNLGDRESHLADAAKRLNDRGIQVLRSSSIYETAAWGIEDQPGFLNQVLEVVTVLDPAELLKAILEIEQDMGRIRVRKWGERLIDIDILYYHDQVIDTEALKVPHPGIPNRRFTLVPLVELDAKGLHPILYKSQELLLEECTDPLEVKVYAEA